MRYIHITVLSVFFLSLLFGQQPPTDRFLRTANRIIEGINQANFNLIQSEYGQNMADFSLAQTTYFFQSLIDRFGKATRLDQLKLVATNRADFVLYFDRGAQDVQLYLDNQNKIAGYLFSEHVAPPPLIPAPIVHDKQKTELWLPFKGNWVVSRGGEAPIEATTTNLLTDQYAFEFMAVDDAGRQQKTNGAANDDFYGYGKEVLAPADGIVADIIDGIRDNTPGTYNVYSMIGNTIIIQHNPNECSVLAYLKQNSFRVHIGDRVTKGQVIALCGNSGSSIKPRIHFHMQDSPNLMVAKGIKFYFEKAIVTKNGKKEIRQLLIPAIGDQLTPE